MDCRGTLAPAASLSHQTPVITEGLGEPKRRLPLGRCQVRKLGGGALSSSPPAPGQGASLPTPSGFRARPGTGWGRRGTSVLEGEADFSKPGQRASKEAFLTLHRLGLNVVQSAPSWPEGAATSVLVGFLKKFF